MALNRIAVVYKVGDQDGIDDLKHGDPICYIDESEWGLTLEEIIGVNNYRVFLVMEHDPLLKPFIQDSLQSIGYKAGDPPKPDPVFYRARKRRLMFDVVSTVLDMPFLEQDLLAKDVIVPIVNAKSLDSAVFVDALLVPRDTGVVDTNLISAGTYTVGTGGDYATWALFAADVAALTGDLTGSQISATTETASCSINKALAGHILTLTSDTNPLGDFNSGHLSSNNAAGRIYWFYLICSSAVAGAEIRLTNLNLKDISALKAYALFISESPATNMTFKINDCLFDANAKADINIYFGSTIPMQIFNVVAVGATSAVTGAGISAIVATASTVIENCTFYNNSIGLRNSSNTAYTAKNIASFGNTKDYTYTAADTLGLGNTVASKCASSDTSGSEASLRSLVAADEFESTTQSQSNFLKVKTGGQCDDGGAAIGLAANIYGIRSNIRPHATLYSIGADELVAAATGGTFARYSWLLNDDEEI